MKNIKDIYIKSINKNTLLEWGYLFILTLYLIKSFFDTTMFSLPWPSKYYLFVRLCIVVYLVIKVILDGYKGFRKCLFYILYLSIFYFAYRATGYMFLIELGFLVLGAKDVSYKKILGLYLFLGSSIMVITMLASLTGCIKDLIYIDHGKYKHAFGIVYTTDFGAHIFFLILAYLAYRDKISNAILNILLVFTAIVLYLYSGTRNSSGSLLLLVLGNLYIRFTDKVWINANDGNSKIKNIRLRMIKYIDYCFIFSVPILAVLSIILAMFYLPDNKILSIIDSVSSGRLNLGHSAIQNYGISLWGTPFDMIGAGGDTVWRTGYNFVDSSYVMIFVRYGSVLLILTVTAFVWIAIKAKKAGKRHILILLWVMAIQCVVEHHMLEIAYNPFILFAFARIGDSIIFNISPINKYSKRSLARSFPIVAAVFFLVLRRNEILAYGRTLVKLLKLNDSMKNIYFIFGVILILIVFIITILAFGKLLYYIVVRDYKKKICKWAIISGIGGTSLCIGFQLGKGLIKQISADYTVNVETNTALLKSLTKKGGYKIYIDNIPYLYMINKDKINNIISGTPYRYDNKKSIIITYKTNEMTHLLRSGYNCGELSETDYIYTNDQTISDLLRESGIEMNNYYAAVKNVDLIRLAEWNGLNIDSEGRLLIDGCKKSLSHGPWVTIYNGHLSVDFDITLIDTDIAEGKIATLRLSYGSGAMVLKEVVVNKSDFDVNGHLLTSITCDIPDSEGNEFLIFAEGNTKIRLNSLSYRKVDKE